MVVIETEALTNGGYRDIEVLINGGYRDRGINKWWL